MQSMKRKQEQKANNVSLFERVKNIIGKNILSVDTRYHMQDTLLIALMIICGFTLTLCNIVLHEWYLLIDTGIFFVYSIVLFVCNLLIWKKIGKYIHFLTSIPTWMLIIPYFSLAPIDPIYTYWISFIPVLLISTLGLKRGWWGGIGIFVISLIFQVTPLREILPYTQPVAIENYTIYVVTYTLTAFLSLLLGFSVTVFNEFIIEKLASLEARYYDASRTDKLTGLSNQMRFSQYIDSLKKNYKEGETINLMFIDVDNFKSINDNYGHLVGNDVLVLLAKAFTMNPHELTIRWGGDEFVIIEKNKTKEEFVKEANDLIKTVSEIRHPDYPDLQVTISVGISIQKIDKNFSFDKFINSADDSVNKAKRQGKNQVQM